MEKDYEQFGPEWEKEISKLPKKVLISMLKAKAIKILELEELESKLKKLTIGVLLIRLKLTRNQILGK